MRVLRGNYIIHTNLFLSTNKSYMRDISDHFWCAFEFCPPNNFGSAPVANSKSVNVIGLGYVGLPLAVAFANQFKTTGFDIDTRRIAELNAGRDRTNEIGPERLAKSRLVLTSNLDTCPPADFYIITVPTPIDKVNRPDLSIIEAASLTVGRMLPRAVADGHMPIVIFESTVYPGVTEDICGPILERKIWAYLFGEDFFLGYSPERINR